MINYPVEPITAESLSINITRLLPFEVELTLARREKSCRHRTFPIAAAGNFLFEIMITRFQVTHVTLCVLASMRNGLFELTNYTSRPRRDSVLNISTIKCEVIYPGGEDCMVHKQFHMVPSIRRAALTTTTIALLPSFLDIVSTLLSPFPGLAWQRLCLRTYHRVMPSRLLYTPMPERPLTCSSNRHASHREKMSRVFGPEMSESEKTCLSPEPKYIPFLFFSRKLTVSFSETRLEIISVRLQLSFDCHVFMQSVCNNVCLAIYRELKEKSISLKINMPHKLYVIKGKQFPGDASPPRPKIYATRRDTSASPWSRGSSTRVAYCCLYSNCSRAGHCTYTACICYKRVEKGRKVIISLNPTKDYFITHKNRIRPIYRTYADIVIKGKSIAIVREGAYELSHYGISQST
ncbi:hypothetical protein PUN28_008420 [Cardiocondyla obscurior]|uniref:Phlebovirus glycoprotein G2 fusion domain-containing protein n=1 Tax=Cardiocondyla obscurior TaxID=286306 RepID=A0AAW2FZC0_9HYME